MTKKIGICRLSNPVSQESIQDLLIRLKKAGYDVYVTPYLNREVDGKTRAESLNDWFSKDFDFIFDVSGGDLSIECVPYLDVKAYQNSSCLFCGYSDLTPVLNVLGQARKTLLFQIRHHQPFSEVLSFIDGKSQELLYSDQLYYGGNIRCFLKLAGTPYFPSLQDHHVFLESHSGSAYRIRSYLAQLECMKALEKIRSLTLGQFTQLDEENERSVLEKWGTRQTFSVYHTNQVGHSISSKALWIGQNSDTL